MKKILIIEDDTALAGGLCRALTSEENISDSCGSLKDARIKISGERYDLIILDVNLPDGSGFDFLNELKEKYSLSVIMLTANDMEADIVAALENGADDYITKPFSLAVLRARVNTQLKKSGITKRNSFVSGKYSFDFERMEFKCNGALVDLSKTEQKLLKLLTDNAGITLSRSDLVDRIWTDGSEYVDENALSVTVKRLRDKLNAQECIKTVYGIGYVWENEDD